MTMTGSRRFRWFVRFGLCLCALFAGVQTVTRGADPAFRKPLKFRAEGKETSAELRWDAAARTLTLHDAAGMSIPWPESLSLIEPAPRPPALTPVESPDEAVAILGYRERLSGRIRSVRDRREVTWSIGDAATVTKFDSASVFAWAFNPGKSVLLYRNFEDPADGGSFEPQGPAADGRRMLRLAGSRRESLVPSSADPAGRALFQIAFEEAPAAADNGPLTLAVHSATAEEPLMSVRLESKDDTWELSFPGEPDAAPARIPRKPGLHRLGILTGEGRIRFCLDESIVHSMRSPRSAATPAAVAVTAEPARPRAVDSLFAIAYASHSKTLQWPIEDDALHLAGGHEWLGTVKSLQNGTWTLIDGDRERNLPLGLTESWIPPARRSDFRWLDGTVVEITFYVPTASIWNSSSGDGHLASLGLLASPENGQDRVEGVVENCDDRGITLGLSQGGSIVVPFDRIVAIRGSQARGLRIVDSRPCHLGDEVDLRVLPPSPFGNRLELNFEATATEAQWQAQLAVDVLEVLGAESPRFSDLIRKGELVTEVRLNDVLIGQLNDKVTSTNEIPERIRFDLPAGSLKPGTNRIEFRQKGRSNDPNYLDDLTILGVRLYRKP